MIMSKVKKDENAELFFEEYRYDKNGEQVPLPERIQAEYVWNASVLNALISELDTLRPKRNMLGVAVMYGKRCLPGSRNGAGSMRIPFRAARAA